MSASIPLSASVLLVATPDSLPEPWSAELIDTLKERKLGGSSLLHVYACPLPAGRVVTGYILTKWADLSDEPLSTVIRRRQRHEESERRGH